MIDKNDIDKFSKIIFETNNALRKMVPSIALAKSVIDAASDRRKKLLAECMVPFTKDGMKGASAENAARATKEYSEGFDEQQDQLKSAYEVDFDWRRLTMKLDSARSLLAVSRETMHNFRE